MSAKQGIYKWHRWESINIFAKCIVHMYITAELKVWYAILGVIELTSHHGTNNN